MLIEIPYKSGDTITIKLSSGDEVIGRFESKDDANYHLNKPMTFIMGPQGLGLVPYLFSAAKDAKIAISRNFVISVSKTDAEISKTYIHQTTGLHV